MIPAQFGLTIYQGDSFGEDWTITLPSLAIFGGPSDLSSAGTLVAAQIRARPGSPDVLAQFTVQIVDAALRKVRPKLTPAQTALLTRDAVWDLQVTSGAWVGTPLGGKVTVVKQVTA